MNNEYFILCSLCAVTLGLACGLGALLIDSQLQVMGMMLGLVLGGPTAWVWQRRRRAIALSHPQD